MKMNNKLIVVENFFDDPDSVRKCGIDFFNSPNGNIFNDNGKTYPGFRSYKLSKQFPHIHEEIQSKVEFHTGEKYSKFTATFHLTNSTHGCGLIHFDRKYLAGVIYLNEFYPQNTGTKVVKSLVPGIDELPELLFQFPKVSQSKDYNVLQDFAKLKRERAKEYYKDSIVIHGEYNRLVVYDGNFLHTPDNYFGFNLYNSRLTIAFFADL